MKPSLHCRPCIGNASGFALLQVSMLLLLALTLGAATMLYTLTDAKSTQHYATGNQAFAAAEAGLLDVINTIQTAGVIDFRNDVVSSGIISTAVTPIAGFASVSYQVTSLTAGANPATEGTLIVTGNAPLSAQRILQVKVERDALVYGPGALHLSNDSATGRFSGASFEIDGNNWTVDTATDPPTASLDASVPAKPGVSTRNDSATDAIVNGLTSGQQSDITGLGYSSSPLTPSVVTTAGASTASMLRMIDDILAKLPTSGPLQLNSIGASNLAKPQYGWGTAAQPLVTRLTASSPRISGNVEGYGILIVDHDIDLSGTMNWYGWVLFKNPSANGVTVGGNATVYGSVWSPLPAFDGHGNFTVDYCQSCLSRFADLAGNGSTNGGNLPHSIVVTSWSEL